jgi:5'-nucleotidase
VLLLDSGDFMMGHALPHPGLTAAAELTEMGKLKYDAITIGNHELDWGPRRWPGSWRGGKNGFSSPGVHQHDLQRDGSRRRRSREADDGERLRRKVIKDVGGHQGRHLRPLGKDASDVSPLKRPLTFSDIAVASRAAVKELRETDKVDVVIALSHSGTDAMGMGEDRSLAEDAMLNAPGASTSSSAATPTWPWPPPCRWARPSSCRRAPTRVPGQPAADRHQVGPRAPPWP